MDRSNKLLIADNYQYLYNQILQFSRSKAPNNAFKWFLIEAFDGKDSNLNNLKRLVAEHKFQTYERHRALYFFNALNE